MQQNFVPSEEEGYHPASSEYDIPKTRDDRDYNELTFLATQVCEVPVAQINVIDEDTFWNKSVHGAEPTEIPLRHSLCEKTIHSQNEVVILCRKDYPDLFKKAEENYGARYQFYLGIPLYDPKGRAIATFCVFDTKPREFTPNQLRAIKALANQTMNLFEHRQQNHKLQLVQKELEQKYRDLEKFARLVSHDIKSPLANIISLTELLKEENRGKFDEDTEQYLNYLTESSYSLRSYVDGILSFYRSEQISEKEYENVDLHKLLKGIADLYAYSDDVEIIYPENVILHHVNKAALSQVFMNLISNALKYNEKPIRKVIIRFSETEKYYHFEVEDNGTGISKENFSKIFELFSTLDVNDREGNPGSGIGLATVKKHIEHMQGNIKVESEVGKGTTFKFKIRKL